MLGFLLLAAAVRAQEAAPRRVVAVRFEGTVRYGDAFLKEQIATKEGELFDPGLLRRDEKTLRQFFSGVLDIEENAVEGGVEIVFHVLDKVVVGEVELRSLSRVRKEDLLPLLATRKGRPLHEHALKSDREIIARMHREKGYHFVDVEAYRVRTSKADVEDIVFQVFAGPRVRVYEVVLEGARSLPRGDLLRVVRNSDRYRKQFLGLGKLINPSYFHRGALEEDRRKLELQYQQEGWLDAKVVLVGVRFDDARKRATIHYRFDEGVRYDVASVSVVYTDGGLPEEADREALAPASLAALATMETGKPYRVDDVRTSRRDISERLWSRAYATSQIEERYTADPATHTVDFRFVVTAGPKVREGFFRIFGNRHTRDNVIRRAFRSGATPGDFLDIEQLEAGRNRLVALRYFNLVRFGSGQNWGLVKTPDGAPDEYDVELEVEEAETRNMSFGAGLSTDGGAFASFGVTWKNFDWKRPPEKWWRILDKDAFRGGGQTFSFFASPGTTFSSFSFSFADPAVRDSPWSLSWSLYRRISLFEDYDQQGDGLSIRVGRFLDEERVWKLDFDWSLRQVILDDPDPDAPVNALDQQGSHTLHGVGVSLRRSSRRDVDLFLNGHVTNFSAELIGGPFGGHVDTVKSSIEHAYGWRTHKMEDGAWHRMVVSASAHGAWAFGDSPEVPIFERFFLGGRSLRGFEFREVGPRSNDRPTGGEFMLLLNAQYTIPLVDAESQGFGLDLNFFVDQGGLSTDFGTFSGDDWRISAGFGLGIAFGGPTQPPLTIDFGIPLRRGAGDRKQLISVSFERTF